MLTWSKISAERGGGGRWRDVRRLGGDLLYFPALPLMEIDHRLTNQSVNITRWLLNNYRSIDDQSINNHKILFPEVINGYQCIYR